MPWWTLEVPQSGAARGVAGKRRSMRGGGDEGDVADSASRRRRDNPRDGLVTKPVVRPQRPPAEAVAVARQEADTRTSKPSARLQLPGSPKDGRPPRPCRRLPEQRPVNRRLTDRIRLQLPQADRCRDAEGSGRTASKCTTSIGAGVSGASWWR